MRAFGDQAPVGFAGSASGRGRTIARAFAANSGAIQRKRTRTWAAASAPQLISLYPLSGWAGAKVAPNSDDAIREETVRAFKPFIYQ